MPAPRTLTKAELREITWTEDQQVRLLEKRVSVQFNPESLKVVLSNQKAGGDQRGGSATQYVGQGTSKLSFDLWFDVNATAFDMRPEDDVRRLTEKVAYFIKPRKTSDDKYIAPGVRFSWGTFWFDGTMDSLNETLEFFSEDGRPLRAQLSVSLSQQEIQFNIGRQGGPALGQTPPGTVPQQTINEGDTLQDKLGENWQEGARQRDIERPRHPPTGQTLPTGR